MIFGVGTDVCDVRRIRATLERHGERFARKVLSNAEFTTWQARSARWPERGLRYLATRFSAKEAFSKAIGLGMRMPMTWRDCEVAKLPSGQPVIVLEADGATIRKAAARMKEQSVDGAAYIEEMFSTGHDAANSAVFSEFGPDNARFVGLSFRAPKKIAD